MTQIISISGKKQAGKNTSGNFFFGLQMWSIVDDNNIPLIDYFKIDNKGRLIIPVDFGPDKGGIQDGIFDPMSKEPIVQMFLAENVWDKVKLYSFADSLKDVCQNLFGLTVEQCYGSNEQKNTSSKVLWKDVPGFPTTKSKEKLQKMGFVLEDDWSPDSYMSARHLLQYVGTEIFRKMYHNVWVDATIKKIQFESPEYAIITDCRFPNEVLGTKEAGGIVVRLTRAPFESQDTHESEEALNPEVFDWSNFDIIIDNKDMTIDQQNEAFFNSLVEKGILIDSVVEPITEEKVEV